MIKELIKELKVIQQELLTCKDEVRLAFLGNRLDIIEKKLAEFQK